MAQRSAGTRRVAGRALGLIVASALTGFGLAVALALTAAPTARAAPVPRYAPLNQPGSPLSVLLAKLRASLYCEQGVRNAAVEPVLLNPATGVTPEENYSWNWELALNKLGIPWCTYTAPNHTLGDIETSGEYLVYAIRTVYGIAHRKIAIMGHSQGGMSMRWPLRFWPDTRKMVNKVIGFSGSNHGTTVASAQVCAPGCPPADWQQICQSRFIQALNSYAETFPGISYTEIYTNRDEVVQPNSGPNASAALHTGRGQITNVATQQICPADPDEHLLVGTVDPVAYALAMDALTHSGAADPARIPNSFCSQLYMPGVNPLNLQNEIQTFEAAPTLGSVTLGFTAGATAGAPVLKSEPPLACYVFAACTGSAAATLRISYTTTRRSSSKRSIVHVHVDVLEGSALQPVPGATIRLAGRRHKTDGNGNATFRLKLDGKRTYRIGASLTGCNFATKSLA